MLAKALLVVVFIVVAAVLYRRFTADRVSGSEARALVSKGAALIDVRSPREFSGGHIEGAINVPVGELSARLDELGEKSGDIVLYCRSGARSAMAKRLLERNGFENVHDLGGMGQW